MAENLREILQKHKGKASDKWDSYIHFYDTNLADLRSKPIRLLEIGVQNGGSLEIWGKYFPKAEIIVGCDVNQLCEDLEFDDHRIHVIVDDAGSKSASDKISALSEHYDIVIDDGSHESRDIIANFSNFFPMLSAGGVYIAEDLHCSYFGKYNGGTEAAYSSMNFFKRIADYVNREHWGAEIAADSLLEFFSKKWKIDFDPNSLSNISEVVFRNSVALVRKGVARENLLGDRVISGVTASVEPAILNLNDTAAPRQDERNNKFGPTTDRIEVYEEKYRNSVELLKIKDADNSRLQANINELELIRAANQAQLDKREANITMLKKAVADMQAEIAEHDATVQALIQESHAKTAELVKARRNPVKLLGRLVEYRTLKLLSKARPILSKKAVARFRKSAAKRHPGKIPSPKDSAVTQERQQRNIDEPIPSNSVTEAQFVEAREAADLSAKIQLVSASSLWDEQWYVNRHLDEIIDLARTDSRIRSALHHYLISGWKSGYAPSPNFGLKRATNLGEDPLSRFLRSTRFVSFLFEENTWYPTKEKIKCYVDNHMHGSAERVIYTCIVGGYDDLIQPMHIDQDSDYVCFTDSDKLLESESIGVWKIRPIATVENTPSLTNRWHKTKPHILFPEYSESIYIDGNVNFLSDFLFEEIRRRKIDLLVPMHFSRECILQEVETIISLGLVNKEQSQNLGDLIETAKSEGFPANWGLTENNVLFRKHNEPSIIALMEDWWWHIEHVAPRDQGHFMYLLWKHGFSYHDIVFPNCRSLIQDFSVVRHNLAEERKLAEIVTDKLRPAHQDQNVPIVLSCNESFVDFMDVLISSILQNSSSDRNYDIIVLEKDLSERSKKKLVHSYAVLPNFSIRFFNMNAALSVLEGQDIHIEGYVPLETYNKIFLNEILEGYDKIAYVDTDIVVNRDIAEFLDIDLFGRSIGASLNVANIHAAQTKKEIKGRQFQKYLTSDLGILDHNKYFQAGILLIDLEHPNTKKLFRKSLEKIKQIREPIFFDQCIFNSIFYGDVYFFSTEWNVVWYLENYSHLRETVPDELFFDYARSRNNPAIVHFASGNKPTNTINWRLGTYFWRYARQSGSYKNLLESLDARHRRSGQVLTVENERWVDISTLRVLVHVHLFYEDQLKYMLDTLRNTDEYTSDVYFTVQIGSSIDKKRISECVKNCHFIEVENLGYDLFPFMEVLRRVNLSQYDYVLKLHTKSRRTKEQGSVYGIDVNGYRWRDALVNSLAGSPEVFRDNIERLEIDRTIGAIVCKDFLFSSKENDEERTYNLSYWRQYLGIESGSKYVGGTMFLARAFPFEHFKMFHGRVEFFGRDQLSTKSHKDFAHVLERFCGIVIENEGLAIVGR